VTGDGDDKFNMVETLAAPVRVCAEGDETGLKQFTPWLSSFLKGTGIVATLQLYFPVEERV
jgi:hypothetical protein